MPGRGRYVYSTRVSGGLGVRGHPSGTVPGAGQGRGHTPRLWEQEHYPGACEQNQVAPRGALGWRQPDEGLSHEGTQSWAQEAALPAGNKGPGTAGSQSPPSSQPGHLTAAARSLAAGEGGPCAPEALPQGRQGLVRGPHVQHSLLWELWAKPIRGNRSFLTFKSREPEH